MNCRLGGEAIEVMDFGDLAVTGFKKEPCNWKKAPLRLLLGKESGLLQLADKPDPEMYREYWYRSGTNESMRMALKDVVDRAHTFRGPQKKGELWLDIACNDGTLLQMVPGSYHKAGFDPSRNLNPQGIQTFINDFFSAETFHARFGNAKADIITSIAVFYDLDDPKDFVRQVKSILEEDGVWVIQMSYLPLMIEQNAFDNICHEHVTYWTLDSINDLLWSEDLYVQDVEFNDVNGGSFRIYVGHNPCIKESTHSKLVRTLRISSAISLERQLSLTAPITYINWFAERVLQKNTTMSILREIRDSGKTILGYGASTKGNTLLQWYGIDSDLIPAIADRQPEKHGLYCAGSDIKVISEEAMREIKPDYLFVLPWHFIDNFKIRENEFLARGGKFIVPLPTLEVIG